MDASGPAAVAAGAPVAPRKRARPEPTPLQRGVALLTRREHSRVELARKLVERGIASEQAEQAVTRLAAEGWQSDARFVEMLVRTRVAQGYGPVRIRAELRLHDIGGAAVEEALDECGCDWAQVARDLATRRFARALAGDATVGRKAADFLYRRGFDGEMVRNALRRGHPD